MAKREGLQTGKGLKSGLNMADTGSVVNMVRGHIATGRMRVSGNDPRRNSMVSGNTGMRRKNGG